MNMNIRGVSIIMKRVAYRSTMRRLEENEKLSKTELY